ncbi:MULTISPECIES: hypothetical protein [Nesterenkonia]|uniref:hypothetical protein n=1 Tax=Nesterenkonia TaxID=57494 RepID=UPI0011B7452E|nr:MULTISPECIES: hypothetical protein [Nesterenkonia]
MKSQESDKGELIFALGPSRGHDTSKGRSGRESDDDDLGFSASNRAVGITLAIGIGLMVLVLMLPYIGGL